MPKWAIVSFMQVSVGLCLVSYLLAALSPWPVLSLIGCGLCGFSVGILWPGTFSLASRSISYGATSMFALLALSGDLGCALGPTSVGIVASLSHGYLSVGLLFASVFPLCMIIGLILYRRHMKKRRVHEVS